MCTVYSQPATLLYYGYVIFLLSTTEAKFKIFNVCVYRVKAFEDHSFESHGNRIIAVISSYICDDRHQYKFIKLKY